MLTKTRSHLPDRAHLDRAGRGAGDLRRDLDRLVEVGAVDGVEPADLLLRLGEGTVGGEDFAVTYLDGGRVGGGPEPLAAGEHAAFAHLLAEGGVLTHPGLVLVRAHRGVGALVGADHQQVAHEFLLLLGTMGSSGWSYTPTTSARDRKGQGRRYFPRRVVDSGQRSRRAAAGSGEPTRSGWRMPATISAPSTTRGPGRTK